MELLAQRLPSGYKDYPFLSLKINPMTFAQVLEYMENLPSSPVERFYYDYTTVLSDDLNINKLLLCDLEFVVFYKKCLTINKDLRFPVQTVCPDCSSVIDTYFNIKDIRFINLEKELLDGIKVRFYNDDHKVRMPTVSQFMYIFSAYRRYKKVSDMNIIKLIALFENSETQLQKYESMVVDAVYEDTKVLVRLHKAYYSIVEPINCICEECKRNFERLKLLKMEEIAGRGELDKDIQLRELQMSVYGGVAVSIDNLIANFFRAVTESDGPDEDEILHREIRRDEKY